MPFKSLAWVRNHKMRIETPVWAVHGRRAITECVCVSLGFHTDVHQLLDQSDMITEKTLPEFNWNLIIIIQRSEKPSLQLFDVD